MTRNLTARKVPRWTLMIFSSGETTINEHALSAGRKIRGGMDVRLLNVESEAGAGLGVFEDLHGSSNADHFARKLRQAALRYYGTPIRAFVRQLVDERTDESVQELRIWQSDLVKQWAATHGEESRAAARFALVGIAGELAIEYGIAPWRRGEATEAAHSAYCSWLRSRGGYHAVDDLHAVAHVRLFLEKHLTNRFRLLEEAFAGNSLGDGHGDLAGFRRRCDDEDSVEFWILEKPFQLEICAA
jgi:putative DNA primase/helicase